MESAAGSIRASGDVEGSDMTRHLIVITLIACAGALKIDASSTLNREVGRHPIMGDLRLTSQPRPACSYVLEVAAAAGVPAGCEEMSAHLDEPGKTAESALLTGLTLGEALRRIGESFSAYEYKLWDGVVVVRPSTSWKNPRHYLNHRVPVATWGPLSLKQIMGRIDAVWTGHSRTIPDDGFLDVHRVHVNVPAGSFLDLLNGIVRQDGQLTWRVGFREVAHTASSYYLELANFEGRGGGMQLRHAPRASN